MAHTCIHWFRKGLRLHDNPALMAALRDCRELYPVFILDPYLHNSTCVGINRWRFLIGALKDLDCSLRKLNSRLFVVRGKPEEVLPELFDKWKVTKLTYEYDTEPYSLSRDKAVTALAKEHGVEVIYKVSHTIYDTDRVIEENNGKAPLTFNRMQTILKALGPPKRPIPAPAVEHMKDVKTPCSEKQEKKYAIPVLEELGHDTATLEEELFPGGEQEALRRLEEHMKRTRAYSAFSRMEKLRAQNLNMDLCNIYKDEIKVLSRDIEVLQLERQEMTQHYGALIAAEKKEQEAMLLEIEKLKNELLKAEAINKYEMSVETAACPLTVEGLQQQLEEERRKHNAEKQMLITKLSMVKQELKDLNQAEKDLRIQAEAEKLAAVEIAEILFQKLEDMEKIGEVLFHRLEEARATTEKLSVGSQMLADKLKKEQQKQEALVQDLVELTQILHQEKALRVQAENNELEGVAISEALQKRGRRAAH